MLPVLNVGAPAGDQSRTPEAPMEPGGEIFTEHLAEGEVAASPNQREAIPALAFWSLVLSLTAIIALAALLVAMILRRGRAERVREPEHVAAPTPDPWVESGRRLAEAEDEGVDDSPDAYEDPDDDEDDEDDDWDNAEGSRDGDEGEDEDDEENREDPDARFGTGPYGGPGRG